MGSLEVATRDRGRPVMPRLWALRALPRRDLGGRLAFLAMVLVVVAVGGLSTVNAFKWVDRPFAGFLVSPRMVVSPLQVSHWSGMQAGLAFPDKILRADGEPIVAIHQIDAVIRRAGVGTPVRYTVERKGRTLEVAVPSIRFTSTDLLVTFGAVLVSSTAYLVIAVLVFVLKPNTTQTWAFVVACVALALQGMTSFDVQTAQWRFARLMLLADTLLLPAAAVHLSLVFPARKGVLERFPRLVAIPYLAGAILGGVVQATYPGPLFPVVYPIARMYTLVGALMLIASTVHAYWATASALARQRAKVVLFGAALAFPMPALNFASSHLGDFLGRAITQTNLIALPLLVFPASIAYAIAKHNLFDVDVYIKRAVGYAIMTLIVGTTYVSMQTILSTFILGPIFGEARETVYPIVFSLLVVFLFNPINRRVQESVDKVFFRTQFDYKKTVSAVSNALTSMLNLDQIMMQVIHTIRSEMFVDTAGVIVLDPQRKACQTYFLGDEALRGVEGLSELPVGYDDPLLALVRQERALVTRYDIEEDPRYAEVREACLPRFSELAATVVMPLVYQDSVTGVLALGQKKSGQFYSREDIELLTTMANQAAVAIENATTHEEVVRYAEELAASLRRIQILESIKTNLAKFVPKTVQELIEESPEAPSFEKREIDCSVLFADITGYTRLSAQLELDQLNQLVERYFGAFLDEILSRGGDVNETAGDGLMVIFRKKDPRRHARAAVLAAIGIQQRTREINAELEGQSEPIVMKVGVNSGIAAVGATRIEGAAGTRWTYTASGPTTNVAARLAALAEGAAGGVIISEETRRRGGDEFQVEDMGPQGLKNVAEPIRVYRVLGRVAAAAELPDVRVEGRRVVRLDIVSRDNPDVYEDLKRRFQSAPDVQVILDRRVGERRQRVEAEGSERRRADRRTQAHVDAELRSQSHVPLEVPIEADEAGEVVRPRASDLANSRPG